MPIFQYGFVFYVLSIFQYGFVFGGVSLVAFIAAPLYGLLGDTLGARNVFYFGVFTEVLVELAFGLLDYVEDGNTFLSLSYILW